MVKNLTYIIDCYRSGLLPTPYIQLVKNELSNETIKFARKPRIDRILNYSSFKDSHLINMKFVNVYFEYSYFEDCLVENCSFETTSFSAAAFQNCVFKNCVFKDCDLNNVIINETIFNECRFFDTAFSDAGLQSCHFLKPIFEEMDGLFGSTSLTNSKFSNSKKSLNFEGTVFFFEIFDQIKDLHRD